MPVTRTRTFTVAELAAIGAPFDLPDGVEVSRELIDTERWSTVHRLLFRHDGHVWAVTYEQGATEHQEVPEFRYDPVTATLMEQREVTVTRWLPVGEETA